MYTLRPVDTALQGVNSVFSSGRVGVAAAALVVLSIGYTSMTAEVLFLNAFVTTLNKYLKETHKQLLACVRLSKVKRVSLLELGKTEI